LVASLAELDEQRRELGDVRQRRRRSGIEVRAQRGRGRAQRVELGPDVGDEAAQVLQVVERALEDAIETGWIAADELVAVVKADARRWLARGPELEVAIGEHALR